MPNKYTKIADMYPEMNFLDEISEFTQDFQRSTEMAVRGVYFLDSQRSIVFLRRHEVLEDILSTIEHETLHHCFNQIMYYGDSSEESIVMDEEQEHDLIRAIRWSVEHIPEKSYESVINGQKIDPLIKEEDYAQLMRKYNKLSDKLSECN